MEKESLINILNVASIAGYSRETNLRCNSKGLRILSKLEDQLLVEARYSSSFFTEYKGDDVELGLDCKHLNRLSKFIDGEVVRVEIKEDECLIYGDCTKIYFSPLKVEDEGSMKKTPFGEVLHRNKDVTKLNDYIYSQITVIPSGKLRPLGGIDELIFEVDNDLLLLVQQAEGVRFEKILSEKVSENSCTTVSISSKNLIAAMNVFEFWYRDITIGIPKKEGYPIIFYDSSKDYEITAMVSPI